MARVPRHTQQPAAALHTRGRRCPPAAVGGAAAKGETVAAVAADGDAADAADSDGVASSGGLSMAFAPAAAVSARLEAIGERAIAEWARRLSARCVDRRPQSRAAMPRRGRGGAGLQHQWRSWSRHVFIGWRRR